MKKKYYYILLIISYLIALSFRIYWISNKKGFHVDESLSVVLSCYNEYMWTKDYETGKKYLGKDVKDISLCDNDSIKNVFGDIKKLWKDNRDGPHTNFYYSLLRIALAGLKNGDINKIILRGCFLNLILFSVSFFVFSALIKLLFKNDLIAILAVFCTFLSPQTISNTLFVRPYQLQETVFIIFVFLIFKFIDKNKIIIFEKNIFINAFLLSSMSVITALTLLTGYYAIIFVGLFGIYLIYYNIKEKKYKEIIFYIFILIISVAIAQVLYLKYLSGFTSSRATETVNLFLKDKLINNIIESGIRAVTFLRIYYFTMPVIIFIAAGIIYLIITKIKLNISLKIFSIFIISFIYIFIVTMLAPYKELRYSMPVFPFLIILPIILLHSIRNKKIFYIFSIFLCLAYVINIFDAKRIDYLYKDKHQSYKFIETPEIPVFVINRSIWKYADIVPYFADNQIYIFNNKIDENFLKSYKYKDFYLVVESSYFNSQKQKLDPRVFLIDSKFYANRFYCMKISTVSF